MNAQSPKSSTPSPRTPNKDNNCFSPVILPSSPAELVNQKNITGLPRVIRDIAADLYNSIQKWNGKHISGAAIVQQIAIVKSQATEQLPPGLEPLLEQLYEVVQCLQDHCKALVFSKNQITSLVRLQKDSEPLFISLTIEDMAKIVCDIVNAYEKEFKAKEYILENIAYSKTKQEVMFFSANWAHQINIKSNISLKLESLLTETGHRRVV